MSYEGSQGYGGSQGYEGSSGYTPSGGGFLLDTYAGYAWDLNNKLSSTATYAFELRRSSDSALKDIGFVGDKVDKTAITDFIGASGGFVSKVYGQGLASGINFGQTNTARQLRIVQSGTLEEDSLGNIRARNVSDDWFEIDASGLGIFNSQDKFNIHNVCNTVASPADSKALFTVRDSTNSKFEIALTNGAGDPADKRIRSQLDWGASATIAVTTTNITGDLHLVTNRADLSIPQQQAYTDGNLEDTVSTGSAGAFEASDSTFIRWGRSNFTNSGFPGYQAGIFIFPDGTQYDNTAAIDTAIKSLYGIT